MTQRMTASEALPRVVVPYTPGPLPAALPPLEHGDLLLPLTAKTSSLSKKDRAAALSLPSDSLLKDLRALMDYAAAYYRPDDDHDDDWNWMLSKIFVLAAESGLPDALSLMLDVLRLPDELLEYTLGDMQTEEGPEALMLFLPEQLDVMIQFLHKPDISRNSKMSVIIALQSFGAAHPEQQPAITAALQPLAEDYVRRAAEPGFADAWIGTELAMLMFEQPGADQQAIAKDLVKAGLWDDWIAGTPADVLKDMGKYPWYRNYHEMANPDTIWEELSMYEKPPDERPQSPLVAAARSIPLLPAPAAAVKTGRNDPCPCGSGKKYKKCCLGKDDAA